LLQRSDAHIYLSYPFVASWSLREALAVGAPVIGGDTATVTEFVKQGETGLVTPTLDPAALAETVLGLLEDRKLAQKLGANARQFAEATLDLNQYLAFYCQEIERITGKSLADKPNPRSSSPSRAAPVSKGPAKGRSKPVGPSVAPGPRVNQRRATP
jgi:hypothetical protein